MARKLTDARIRPAIRPAKPTKLTDGNGLYLLVHPNGSKYWRYRYRLGKRENVFAIGQYPEITLQAARDARDAARRMVKAGRHPAHERKAALVAAAVSAGNTFQVVAEEWIEKNLKHWTPSYAKQVKSILNADVFPVIGVRPIDAVNSHDVLTLVERVATRGATSVATLIRQWCSAIFRYGVSTLRCQGDPAAAVKGAIKRPKVRHKNALLPQDLARLLRAIVAEPETLVTQALRLLLLTFVRPGELRGARWQEISWEAKEWRIPAERMKMRESHVVPLSEQCIEILQAMLKRRPPSQSLLFPNLHDQKRHMSPTTLNRALERMGWAGQFSAHGFRATASTLLNESGYRSEAIERQLAHKDRNKVRASYNQASYMGERRRMMQAWADYVGELPESKAPEKVAIAPSQTSTALIASEGR